MLSYILEEVEKEKRYRIHAYDCNQPGTDCFIEIKKDAGRYVKWSYRLNNEEIGTGNSEISHVSYDVYSREQ